MSKSKLEDLKRPPSITILGLIFIIIGIFAFTGSFFLWGEGVILNPPADVDLEFPITDILINAPASLIAGIGLFRLNKWGKYMTWFVSGFYIYASVEIFVQLWQEERFPPEIAIPQVLAIIVAIVGMRQTIKYEHLLIRDNF